MRKKNRLIEAAKSVRFARDLANWAEVGRGAWRKEELTRVRLRNGLDIEGEPGTDLVHIYKEIWYRDSYRLRAEPLAPGATVIDIGANVGLFSLYAATVGQAARVLSFEPFPASFALLQANVERNGVEVVEAYPIGVGGETSTRGLQEHGRHGVHSMYGDGQTTIEMECLSFADVLERYVVERCHFLKLDCEGAEFEILLNADDASLARVERMAMEYHDALTPHEHGELVRRLQAAGFTSELRHHARSQTGYLYARRQS